ncbi:uncharacterized protein MYCFIDRAFT_77831 [Pseudocercospora fijiensis CIRAD86]|uniref:Uncharacterized protein n=1 Tax=Pseudocercospora fijiensis (strain CIRAD86) TaxID=383855 RepID=M3ASB1_PSEFD|nr:uncharacterized protein MYCFIDRAFT_77831 [Pseudocercospora fijiensis CIRAD86]EME80043.1 hypothetical protein MYCFIDRAFT_77831 [Pseudocercospora fijiensis CIRAD86]
MVTLRRITLGIGVTLACLTSSVLSSGPAPAAHAHASTSPLRYRLHPRNFTVARASCELNCDIDLCADDPGLCDDADVVWEESILIDASTQASYASARIYKVDLRDGKGSFSISSRPYPGSSLLRGDGSKWANQPYDKAFNYKDSADCNNWALGHFDYPTNYAHWVTEHILELQTVKMFIVSAISGTLPSGATSEIAPLGASWFRDVWNKDVLPSDLPGIGEGGNSPTVPNDRVFEELGSVQNRHELVLAGRELNAVKARIWKGIAPHADDKFDSAVEKWMATKTCGLSPRFIKYLKSVFLVFDYMTDSKSVLQFASKESGGVWHELELIEKYVGEGTELTDRWMEFWCDFLDSRMDKMKDWLVEKISYVNHRIGDTPEQDRPADWYEVSQILYGMYDDAWNRGSFRCQADLD